MSLSPSRAKVHVSSDAGSLVVTCRNVTLLDVTLTVGLLAAGIATVCTIVACIHIFLKFAIWDGSPAIVLHLGWAVGGAFMIILAVHAILRLIPHILVLLKTAMSGSGDVLRIDAVSWSLVCHKPEKGRVGLAGIWWPPTKDVYTGATSALKGASVRSNSPVGRVQVEQLSQHVSTSSCAQVSGSKLLQGTSRRQLELRGNERVAPVT